MHAAEAARSVASAARIGRSVWVWPIVGAVLAAWPVWRSFFAEVQDIGSPPLRGQMAAAAAELVLVGYWVARYRESVAGLLLPLSALSAAVLVLIVSNAHGDTPTADLAAVSICWLAVALVFAGAVLLDGQRAFAAMQGGAAPAPVVLLRAHRRIGYCLLGLALAAATIQGTLQAFLLAALAAVSPGAVLAWACLCDTARSVLARRRVHVADAAALSGLAEHKTIVFGDRRILIANRPKVISIAPVGEVKPAEVVATAIALLAEDDSEVARGLQDFGVAHRLRLPAINLLQSDRPGLRRGRLPDRRIVEIGGIELSAMTEQERAPFADQLARAAELNRSVLALREIEPSPRLLGLLVLARSARVGASEAVRTLRKAEFALVLADPELDASDRDALGGLEVKRAGDWPASAIGIVGPGRASLGSTAASIHFGARAPADGGRDSAIVIARDDPRTLVDLMQFARDFRVRTRMAIIAANLPGLALLAAALGLLPPAPLLVTIAAVAGILLAVAAPQALRLSRTIAKEVDEE